MKATIRRWVDRLGRPLSVAIVFCAAGLASAVFAVGVNRVLSAAPARPLIAVVPGSATATARPSTTPTPSGVASCAATSPAKGDLKSLVAAAPVPLIVTGGSTTLDVMIPTGAALDGQPQDVHIHIDGATDSQPLSGTLVQDAEVCAQGPAGTVKLVLPSGAQVAGSAVAGPTGVIAADIHVRAQAGGDSGDEGG